MFRNIIVLGMLVGAASMAGWFTINREGDQTSIQFNRDEIRSDAARAIDRGRQYLDQREHQFASEQGSASNYLDEGYGYDQSSYQQQSYQQPSYQGQTYNQGQYGAQTEQYGQSQYERTSYDRTQYGQPQNDRSQYGQPQNGQSQYGQPYSGQSQYGQPQYSQPEYGQPDYRETEYQHGGQSYQGNYQQAPNEARGGVRYGVPYQDERNR